MQLEGALVDNRTPPEYKMMSRALAEAQPGVTKFNPLSKIIAHDDFNTGAHGWVQLSGNYNGAGDLDSLEPQMSDFRPPQLSSCNFYDVGTHGAVSGTYALKLATRPVKGHTATAIRRLTMPTKGRVQLEAYFTYKSEARALDPDNAPPGDWDGNYHPSEDLFGAFTLGSDMDDGTRYHCVARYMNTTFDNKPDRRWYAPNVVEPTGKERFDGKVNYSKLDDFTSPDPNSWKPFSEPLDLCNNEVPTKVNWHYLRWQFDLATRTNVELQINDTIYDTSMVEVPLYTEKYRALNGLLNFYFSVRTHANVRNFLYIDSALISIDW
jgi:hypothetical protein